MKTIREPFRLFYKCACGEMIPKTLLMDNGKHIPDTKSHFKSCYMCGHDMRRLGTITARRIVTITRYGFLWLRVKRTITFEYPQEETTTTYTGGTSDSPARIITLDQLR